MHSVYGYVLDRKGDVARQEGEDRLRGSRSLRDVYWSLREKGKSQRPDLRGPLAFVFAPQGAMTPHEVGASRAGGFAFGMRSDFRLIQLQHQHGHVVVLRRAGGKRVGICEDR